MSIFKAMSLASLLVLGSFIEVLSQNIDIQGYQIVLERFEELDVATDSVSARDIASGAPLLSLFVRPVIDSNAVTQLGSANERLQATAELVSVAQQVGIFAEKVGLTEYVRFDATRQQFEAFAAIGLFDFVEIDVAVPPVMASASIQIQLPALHSEGVRGLGKTVVIMDTGVDDTHPDFQGRIIAQACFSRNNSVATSLCPNGQNVDMSARAGRNCNDNDIAACDHGTHVAGIAAGSRIIPNASGVAPAAGIISIQVFSRFTDPAICNGLSRCVLSYTTDQLAALSYVRQNLILNYPIAAINMSLGGGQHTFCPNDVRAFEVTALRRLGVATVISSGNNGYLNHVGAPGCIPDAITVGAVNDNGSTTSFSNSGEAVDILAPGADITAATPNNGHERKWGTSMASPVVAGLISALQSHYTVSVDEIEILIENSGVQVQTLNPVRSRPWIRAHDAWQMLDDSRPAGEFVWMRDQWSDDGSEPNNTGLGLSSSPYIWFRHQADCEPSQHQSQDPEFGSLNFGCVKIHNSGKASAKGTLQMYYSNANFDHAASWQLISSSNETLPPNTTAIIQYPWASVPAPGHYCSIARWVPEGADTTLDFPNGFTNSIKNSNDLIWRNFKTVDIRSGQFVSSLKFEKENDGLVNMVVDISALTPEEFGGLGDLVISLGGEPGDLTSEPTSALYEHEGRFIVIPLRPGVSYIPDIVLPNNQDTEFKVTLRFEGVSNETLGGKIISIKISDVDDVLAHKKTGEGELAAFTYEVVY